MDDATKTAIERISKAAAKAEKEARTHSNEKRADYSDGTAHGLRAAMRILMEEHSRAEGE